MSGDHGVVTKAGTMTSGLERFCSSLYGKRGPGLCFLSFSLLRVKRRTSYPVRTEQVEQPCEALVQEPPKKQAGGRRGRPKGSKNRHRREVALSPARGCIPAHIKKWLEQIGEACKVVYFLCDGELGHHDALHMVRQGGLPLIAKLRYDSALDFPYDGPSCGHGPRRKYGQTVDYPHIPSASLPSIVMEQESKTQMYQMALWHKKFAEMLKVVVIVTTHLHTHKTAHVVLFSSDLMVEYERLIAYYRLRFQREFHFRDAKQYWGREDFMKVNARPVSNGANLACAWSMSLMP